MEIRLGSADDIKEIISKYPYTRQVIGDGGYSIVATSPKTILGFAFIFRREIPCPVEQQ